VKPDGSSNVVLGSSPLSEYSAGVTIYDNVLFYRFDGRQTDIYIVNSAGGTPNPVATSPDYEWVNLIY
jgi:hypothetical protein